MTHKTLICCCRNKRLGCKQRGIDFTRNKSLKRHQTQIPGINPGCVTVSESRQRSLPRMVQSHHLGFFIFSHMSFRAIFPKQCGKRSFGACAKTSIHARCERNAESSFSRPKTNGSTEEGTRRTTKTLVCGLPPA